jgi:hypothetical protein
MQSYAAVVAALQLYHSDFALDSDSDHDAEAPEKDITAHITCIH